MTQPQDGSIVDDEVVLPGTPRWWLERLVYRLMGRQARYDRLEAYALGNHPLPNGDKRYVVALQELRKMAQTNYCELVIHAVTQRMKVVGFQFGPESQTDPDAKKLWNYSDMDYQSPLIIKMAATLGDSYGLVSPPIEDTGEPVITAEDPRMCITEADPRLPTKTLAGLKMWQSDLDGFIYAALYLPDNVYLYEGPAISKDNSTDTATLTTMLIGRGQIGNGFHLVEVQPNPFKEVSLVRFNWQPAFGTMGRAEHEQVLNIQDRINRTVLDRLVISKSQAYNQRWITGAQGGENFKPGSDMVWATQNEEAQFGQFDAVDITQILAAIRDDVGDMAAVSQTPATYLMNRMVNVSGDTLTQDQSALVTKTLLREESLGWSFEKLMRLAFSFKGDTGKAKEPEVVTLWKDPQIYDPLQMGDLFSKLTAGGVPLDVAMKCIGIFTDDQIESAVKQQEEALAREEDMANKQMESEHQNNMAIEKTKAQAKPAAKSAAK